MQDAPLELKALETIFGRVVSVAIELAGIVFFVMLLVGGFKYLTAGGEAPKVESARKTLTYAIFGLVFIALSYLILRFIAAFTGAEGLLQFQIQQRIPQ